jgi:hypothetical protein
MRRFFITTLVLFVAVAASAVADLEGDKVAIRETVLDYIEGWYSGDPERMEQALHPDLAKRIVVEQDGRFQLQPLSALGLVQGTRSGWGSRTPEGQQQKDIEIYDVDGDMATVKLIARDWVDYMHLGRWNGRWVIINVLWAHKPEKREAAGS